jgi:hypothetical protein
MLSLLKEGSVKATTSSIHFCVFFVLSHDIKDTWRQHHRDPPIHHLLSYSKGTIQQYVMYFASALCPNHEVKECVGYASLSPQPL